jgi:hypothetical protein
MNTLQRRNFSDQPHDCSCESLDDGHSPYTKLLTGFELLTSYILSQFIEKRNIPALTNGGYDV